MCVCECESNSVYVRLAIYNSYIGKHIGPSAACPLVILCYISITHHTLLFKQNALLGGIFLQFSYLSATPLFHYLIYIYKKRESHLVQNSQDTFDQAITESAKNIKGVNESD